MSSRLPRRPLLSVRSIAAAAVVLAVAGCASIPTSGPVKAGGDLRLERADDGVSVIGEPPRRGATPSQIINGFLDSSADFQSDHEVARLYLTAAASRGWRPQSGTRVYDKTELSVDQSAADPATYLFDAPAVGDIGSDGEYRRPPVEDTVTRQFRLARVDGEWRIADLEDGLLLSSSELADTYRQVSLYFLAPSGATLVPDTVLIPELPGLSTKVVARLLRGPSGSLRGAVTTAFPEGTTLDVSSVPVTDGIATVQLDDTALKADDTARQQMSAQLVWTLKQLAGVAGIRIRAGGEDLQVNSAGSVQQRTDWPTFDPDQLTSNLSAYVELDGRIGRYLEGKFSPVLGEGGEATPQVGSPAVSLDNNARLAAVSADGHSVLVGPMVADAALEPRISGGRRADFSAPSWDRDNGLWVVDRHDGVLYYLATGATRPQQVKVPPLGEPVQGVRISRDGARAALLVGTGSAARLEIGAVRRVETADPQVAGGELLSLAAVAEPLPGLLGVRDMAWADATHVEVLGSLDGAALRPYEVSVDGWRFPDIEPVPGPGTAVSIAAAPPLGETPLVVGTDDGRLWQFTSSSGWDELGKGTQPAYPG
jgi:hypothetical protein